MARIPFGLFQTPPRCRSQDPHRSPGLRHRRGQLANTFRDPTAEHSEMHPTLSRLAESVSKVPLNLTEASAMLYPPIPLYRRLLRAHRNLPREMRSLGDDYVKSEFRRHKEVTNPVYIMGFLSQWKTYLDQMPRDPNTPFTGKRLDPTVFEKMSDEQLGQLYELMHAAKDVWKPVRPGDGEEQKS